SSVRINDGRTGDVVEPSGGDGRPEGRSTPTRPVEPLSSAFAAGCRLVEHAIRTVGRDHRSKPDDRAGGAELCGPGYRQHGVAIDVRNRAAKGRLAQA